MPEFTRNRESNFSINFNSSIISRLNRRDAETQRGKKVRENAKKKKIFVFSL